MITAYKVFTHDLRPPIQGGDPVWSGTLPHALPVVEVDGSDEECGAGWNACRTAEDALRIGGLWPNGRPSRLYRVETDAQVIERGDKLRAATWTIVEELSAEPAILELSRRWFGEHAEAMAVEQIAWREALTRPLCDEAAVERGLHEALAARGLAWSLRRFDSERIAMDARVARAWGAWGGARDAWVAWDRAAWVAGDAWTAWGTRAAARDAAWDARDACCTQYVSRAGLVSVPPDRHTVGIRDAYRHGLSFAVPTGPSELGWAMEERAQ